MDDVHGYDVECGFRLGGLIQFGHDEVQTPAAFGISVSALDSVPFAGIQIYLPLHCGVSFSRLSATERRPRQADAVLCAIGAVFARLVDPVRQNPSRIAAKLAPVILGGGNQVVSLCFQMLTGFVQVDPGRPCST